MLPAMNTAASADTATWKLCLTGIEVKERDTAEEVWQKLRVVSEKVIDATPPIPELPSIIWR